MKNIFYILFCTYFIYLAATQTTNFNYIFDICPYCPPTTRC